MDAESFVKAFIKALKDPEVVHTLKEHICGDLEKQISTLKDVITAKDSQITSLTEQVKSLESRLDNQEQYSRRNSLRINGLPESNEGSANSVVLDLFTKGMGCDIQLTDIDRAHRIGRTDSSGKIRPMLVKFTSYRSRDIVFRAKSHLKKDQTKKIFINEDLTAARSALFFKARQMRKEKRITDCWTSDGKILVKTRRGTIKAVDSDDGLIAASTT